MNKCERIMISMIISALLLSGCGSVYDNSKNGYTKVTSVKGVEFEMPETFLSKTTTLSSIDKNGDYAKGTYLYKDGSSEYMLFNIEEAVIAVEMGTKFNLKEAEDVGRTITSTSVKGVWLTGQKEKITYKINETDEIYKIVADVVGNVSVTPELYGKYIGYFASVQYGGYECSIFAGVKVPDGGKMSAKQKEILSHIIKSFRIDSSQFK